MADTATTTTVELPFRARVRHGVHAGRLRVRDGVRQGHNWLQLMRFAAVGASGYVLNLAVFAACVHVLAIDYRLAFVVAFVISVVNNFWWNRHWTFDAKHEHPIFQGTRFFAVSVIAQAFAYAVLVALVSGPGLAKVVAQAVALAAATPLSFVGQKLWSFRA
ncbi:MAG: GtrA family protein [Actinobacteria bacterium]|nr:MAG: GtrA family protein [Actinomycetota bacterium]